MQSGGFLPFQKKKKILKSESRKAFFFPNKVKADSSTALSMCSRVYCTLRMP